MRRLVILFAVATMALAGCSSEDGGESGSDTTAAADGSATTADGGSDDTASSDLPEYEAVADIGADLDCELEYDGIVDADREYSTCVFEGEQALIYIYNDPTFVDDIVAAGAPALAYCANWTVEVETAPVAQSVADATGGAVADPAGA